MSGKEQIIESNRRSLVHKMRLLWVAVVVETCIENLSTYPNWSRQALIPQKLNKKLLHKPWFFAYRLVAKDGQINIRIFWSVSCFKLPDLGESRRISVSESVCFNAFVEISWTSTNAEVLEYLQTRKGVIQYLLKWWKPMKYSSTLTQLQEVK